MNMLKPEHSKPETTQLFIKQELSKQQEQQHKQLKVHSTFQGEKEPESQIKQTNNKNICKI